MAEGQRNPDQNKPPFPNKGLTEEELRVLSECRHESFYYRSLPFSVGLMLNVYFLTKRGVFPRLLKPHPKFGSRPQLFGAGFLGYMIGKLSYIVPCQQKMMQLENSPLADALRKRRTPWMITEQSQESESAPAYEQSSKRKTYHSGDNLDMERKQAKGLDDNRRPNMDSDSDRVPVHQPHSESENTTTHEELRRRNREGASPTPPPTSPTSGQPRQAPRTPTDLQPSSTPRVRRNQYGDLVED